MLYYRRMRDDLLEKENIKVYSEFRIWLHHQGIDAAKTILDEIVPGLWKHYLGYGYELLDIQIPDVQAIKVENRNEFSFIKFHLGYRLHDITDPTSVDYHTIRFPVEEPFPVNRYSSKNLKRVLALNIITKMEKEFESVKVRILKGKWEGSVGEIESRYTSLGRINLGEYKNSFNELRISIPSPKSLEIVDTATPLRLKINSDYTEKEFFDSEDNPINAGDIIVYYRGVQRYGLVKEIDSVINSVIVYDNLYGHIITLSAKHKILNISCLDQKEFRNKILKKILSED